MARLKSAAQRAPQTKEQAIAVLEGFARDTAQIALINAARADAIAQIDAKADAELVPLLAGLKDAAKQLKPWWEANFDELTGGKRKSIELASCTIGYRMPPPSLKFANGKDAEGVTVLQANGFGERLVRITYSLDKPEILKVLDSAPPAPADGEAPHPDAERIEAEIAKLGELGFSKKQDEQFFVDANVADASADELKQSLPAAE